MTDRNPPAAAGNVPLEAFLTLALRFLAEADEANHSGDYGTFALQCQARELLAEAIDRLTVERTAALAEMRGAGADFPKFAAASKREARLAADIRRTRALGIHPYFRSEE